MVSRNQMLSNNMFYNNTSRDPSFQQRVAMAKIDKLKQAKNISDLGISRDQLTKYVINPIQLEKVDRNQMDHLYHNKTSEYVEGQSKIVDEWWKGRTNMPYKNIMKNEDYTKDFKEKS